MIYILWNQNIVLTISLDASVSTNLELSEQQDSIDTFGIKTPSKKDSASELSYASRRIKSGESSSADQVQYFDTMKTESENIATPTWTSNESSKSFYKDHPQFIVKYKSKDGKQKAKMRAEARSRTGKASSRYIEDLDQYDVQIVEIDTIDELRAFEEDEDVDYVEESKFPQNRIFLLFHCSLNFEFELDPDRSYKIFIRAFDCKKSDREHSIWYQLGRSVAGQWPVCKQ